MLIRISLIVAIVAGLAAGVVGLVQVRERLITTMNHRDEARRERDFERGEKERTQGELAQSQEELQISERNLLRARSDLTAMATRLQQEEQRASTLTDRLQESQARLTTAEQELNQWHIAAAGRSPTQVRTLVEEIKNAIKEQDVLREELLVAGKANTDLQTRLDRYEPPPPPQLPQNLTGQIVAVDPRYDFVVVNIGSNHGVRPNGELIVNRDGRLISKLRVASVEPTVSIANVIPAWREAEVIEGDQVLAASVF